MTEKKCTKCGEIKPLSEFHKRKASKDGLRYACKPCTIANTTGYKKANRDRVNESRRDWHSRNKDVANGYCKNYYSKNRDSRLEYSRDYRSKNKEKVYESNKRYLRDNPEFSRVAASRRRSLLAGANGSFSVDQWTSRLEYYESKCMYCGSSESIEIEHRIPLSRGGTNLPANLVPACKSCNCKKGTKTETEYKQLLASQEQNR